MQKSKRSKIRSEKWLKKKSQVNTAKVELEGERTTALNDRDNLDPTTDQDEINKLDKKISWLNNEINKAESEWNKLDGKESDLVLEILPEKQAALDLYTDPADHLSQLEEDRDEADGLLSTAETTLATTEGNLSTYKSELDLLKEEEATASDEFKVWKK